MNYKKMGGYQKFHRNKMSVVTPGNRGTSYSSDKQHTIESDMPVTKMRHEAAAHGGDHSGEGMRQSMHGRSFSKGRMSVVKASGMKTQSSGIKQASVESDQPVT